MWIGLAAVIMAGLCILAWIGSRVEPKEGALAHVRAGGGPWSPLTVARDPMPPVASVVQDCPTEPIRALRAQPAPVAPPVARPAASPQVAEPSAAWHPGPLPPTITMPEDATRYGIADDVEIDLAATPHWLIAGATGTGKSVMLNSLLCQMVQRSPDDLRLVLIDPKRVELAPFRGVPHLWRPVATELDDAIRALRAVVSEMDRRYALLEDHRVRNLDGLARHGVTLPRIVVVADEVGDLMIQAKKRVEPLLMRLTALGRAAGIHVIIATQRPSVDVVTGVLKANLPGRIALRTASAVDSRVILDETGAEELRLPGEFICRSGVETVTGRGWLVADEDVDRVTA